MMDSYGNQDPQETPGPLFSVIIPTHARPTMLRYALDSVLAQTESNWEAIVVDDASPSPAAVSPDPRIRLVRNSQSLGPGGARNVGLREAGGKYVAFLDDDDAWTPMRLRRAAALHENADVVVTGTGVLGAPARIGQTTWCRGNGPLHDRILDSTTPPLGATSVVRDLCPAFDVSFPAAEDLDWWLRLTSRTDRVAFDSSADWLWRRHDGPRNELGSLARRAGRIRLMKEHKAYFEKHPRAAAFSWQRIGLLSLSAGDEAEALRASMRSMLTRPSTGGAVAVGKSVACCLRKLGSPTKRGLQPDA